ncbi:MAG: nuclear transport factor 2 family protein [Phycisphaerales bacterium]|nr:nuclear transport factor 2 family protein [Phycisphaerales bacterium]
MMKSRKLLIVLAIPVFVAFAQTQPNRPAGKRTPPPGASVAKPIDSAQRDAMIEEMSKCWAALSKQDWEVFGGYLADNYMMADPSGLSDKAATMAMVKKGRLGRYALSDWRVARVGDGGVAMTYKADQEWIAPDGKADRVNLFCTTTWERRADQWVIVMYSETPERKPEAPAAADK